MGRTAGPALEAKASDARLPLVLLAQVAAAREQSMDVHTWRQSTATAEARWLTFLAGTGYPLSAIEQTVIDKAGANQDSDEAVVDQPAQDDPRAQRRSFTHQQRQRPAGTPGDTAGRSGQRPTPGIRSAAPGQQQRPLMARPERAGPAAGRNRGAPRGPAGRGGWNRGGRSGRAAGSGTGGGGGGGQGVEPGAAGRRGGAGRGRAGGPGGGTGGGRSGRAAGVEPGAAGEPGAGRGVGNRGRPERAGRGGMEPGAAGSGRAAGWNRGRRGAGGPRGWNRGRPERAGRGGGTGGGRAGGPRGWNRGRPERAGRVDTLCTACRGGTVVRTSTASPSVLPSGPTAGCRARCSYR